MLEHIKAVAMDVDGVLTDGTFWWGPDGNELKRFCFADGTGITLAMQAGLLMALISGESSESGMTLVQRYADKLKIKNVYKGCHDKARAVQDFAIKNGLDLSAVCFIGDDIIDLTAMSIAGFSAAPSNAHPSVLKQAKLVTSRTGGQGAVREVLDLILKHKHKRGL